jgi:hypothetical protein
MGFGLGDLIDAGADLVGDAADAIGDGIEGAIDTIEDVADAVDEFADDAVDALGDLAEEALEALEDLGEDALDTAGDIYAAFEELADAAWDGATDLVDGAVDTIGRAAEDAWQAIGDAADSAWGALEEASEDAWEAISDAADELWELVTQAVEAAWEVAVDAVELVADAAANVYERALATIEKSLLWLGELIEDIAQAIAMLGACLAGQVIHDLAEAENVLLNFWRPVHTLPDAFRQEVQPLFPDVPLGDVFYIQEAALSANTFGNGTDAMTFMNPEIAGVNLGYMIYIDAAWDPAVEEDRGLMVHELVHVEQYRQFRFEDAFACAYGIGFVSAGFSYRDNPLEAQAFDVQETYLAAQ